MLSAMLIFLSLAGAPLYEQSPAQVTEYLQGLQAAGQPFEQRLRRVVQDSMGTKYDGGPLGEGPEGKHDADPLVDLTKVDCVTFVEQSVALSIASDYDAMVQRLQLFRYRDGIIDYEHRNHFMISDWIRNNSFCTDITAKLGVKTDIVERTISRKDFFQLVKAPELGQDTPDEVLRQGVIPPSRAAEAEAQLPDTALIVFVGKVDWLFALHCGLYLRDEDGEGYLIHASSKAGEVTKTRLSEYMKSQEKRYLGFSAYSVSEPKE